MIPALHNLSVNNLKEITQEKIISLYYSLLEDYAAFILHSTNPFQLYHPFVKDQQENNQDKLAKKHYQSTESCSYIVDYHRPIYLVFQYFLFVFFPNAENNWTKTKVQKP